MHLNSPPHSVQKIIYKENYEMKAFIIKLLTRHLPCEDDFSNFSSKLHITPTYKSFSNIKLCVQSPFKN